MASQVMLNMGNLSGAQAHATLALEYAEHLEDAYGQAELFWIQGKCQTLLANFKRAQGLLQNGRHILDSCGLQTHKMDRNLRLAEAEIHLLKSEYLESRKIQLLILSTQPNMTSIMAMLNIALIDTVTGLDSKLVQKILETCEIHLKALTGFPYMNTSLMLNATFAVLHLRDGELNKANTILVSCYKSFGNVMIEGCLFCLERLADLSHGMNNFEDTLGWAVILLGLSAVKLQEKLYTMQAFRCLGQIFTAKSDFDTALCLFEVALDGFTHMDIHHWKVDCMV
jgi:tetratricopeptide (TPR) repeat protein